MDGIVGKPLLLVADLPGERRVQVDLDDSLGNPVLRNTLAYPISDERWIVTLPGEMVNTPGIWNASFRGDTLALDFQVVVGNPSPLALSLFDVVCQAASHYTEVVEGRVQSGNRNQILDPRVAAGAGYWNGRYLVLHPEDDLANGLVPRRVVSSDSSGTLELVTALPADPVVGARYALLPVPPQEVLRTLRVAVAEFGRLARMVVTAKGIPVLEGEATIPLGLTHIHAVWAGEERLEGEDWQILPGRRLRVGVDTEYVGLQGLMPLVLPTLPLGWVDCEVTALLAHAGMHLHSARARGPGLDVEEHLRRMIALGQLAEGNVSRLASRVPHGSREVIP